MPEEVGVRTQYEETTIVTGDVREVRISEDLMLARPDLWSREGLEAYLREAGIDPSRPYWREEVFVQLEAAVELEDAA